MHCSDDATSFSSSTLTGEGNKGWEPPHATQQSHWSRACQEAPLYIRMHTNLCSSIEHKYLSQSSWSLGKVLSSPGWVVLAQASIRVIGQKAEWRCRKAKWVLFFILVWPLSIWKVESFVCDSCSTVCRFRVRVLRRLAIYHIYFSNKAGTQSVNIQ